MDGETSGKTFNSGANSAIPSQDAENAIHEHSIPRREPAGDKTAGTGTSAFDKSGAIGKQFTTEGVLGGTAQKLGGPFDKDGAIGKQFTTQGSIGGTV